jgi:hypothetical protein
MRSCRAGSRRFPMSRKRGCSAISSLTKGTVSATESLMASRTIVCTLDGMPKVAAINSIRFLPSGPGELHLKISPAVEPLGRLPSTPGDCCDPWEIGPLGEHFREGRMSNLLTTPGNSPDLVFHHDGPAWGFRALECGRVRESGHRLNSSPVRSATSYPARLVTE